MTENFNEKLHKGTTTVGIVCKDGIVLAADKRASAGYFVADKRAQKIHKVSDNMAVTLAGLVSDAQLIVKLTRAEIKLKSLKTHKDSSVKEVANLMANILYNNIRKFSAVPGIVSFMLGGVDNKGFGLFEIGVDGSLSSIVDYASVGSGEPLAYGVLETLYKKDMTVKEGVELAKKAINAAVQRDLPTGQGIDVWVINSQGVKEAFHKTIEYSAL